MTARRGALLAVAVSTGLSLAAAELVVRAFGLAPALPEAYRDFVADPYLPFRKRPDRVDRGTIATGEFDFEYRYNAEGFRDVDHATPKPAGHFRIVGLGDSFTFGVGAPFEQTWLARLETLLNAREGDHPPVEIVKAGQPNYHPEIERILLEHYGLRYEPDLVIAAVLPNDIWGTHAGLANARPTSEAGYLISREGQRLGPAGVWLYVHSAAARLAIRAWLDRTREAEPTATSVDEMTPAEVRSSTERIAAELVRMQRLAEQAGAAFLLVSIPQQDLKPFWGRHWSRWAAEAGVPFVDTQPPLARARTRTGRHLYWPKDGHCDPEGYDVIARAVFRHLTSRQLVP